MYSYIKLSAEIDGESVFYLNRSNRLASIEPVNKQRLVIL
jgi:hypothetical protein